MKLPFKDDTRLFPHSSRLSPVVFYMPPNELWELVGQNVPSDCHEIPEDTTIVQLLTYIKDLSVLDAKAKIKSESDTTPLEPQRTQA